MSFSKVQSFALATLGNILPLDEESCKEVVNYTLSLPSDYEVQTHYMNLLGDTVVTRDFVRKFLVLKNEAQARQVHDDQKPRKKDDGVIQEQRFNKARDSPAWANDGPSEKSNTTKKAVLAKQVPRTTSEMLEKPVPTPSSQLVKRTEKKNVSNLKDIEGVLAELELSHESRTILRKCNCMATRHPLFTLFPNCLNCGKIICSKEGLQPCSFCGADLMSSKDRREISQILQDEKKALQDKTGGIKLKQKPSVANIEALKKQKPSKVVVKMKTGENMWKAQDRALKEVEAKHKKALAEEENQRKEQEEIEQQLQEFEAMEREKDVDAELVNANSRLETLLNFQETGAERTRIIDNAADFELPNTGGSMWLSPIERALQLKKQHRQLRKHEENESKRAGRGAKTIEMVIKDGKVTMIEKHHNTSSDQVEAEEKNIQAIEDEIRHNKMEADSKLGQQYWDHDNDRSKWERPVYVSTAQHNDANTAEKIQSRNRVQFMFDADENELLAEIPA